MKIAIFTDTFIPQINGVTKTLSRLLKHLDSRGIEYMVFAPEDNIAEQDVFEGHVERFLSFRFFLYPECRVTMPNYLRIKAALDKFKPDVIHVVTQFSMGLAGMKYASDYNVPLVSSYHTDFSSYLDYYNLKFLDGWLWSYLIWFHNQCHTTLCPSETTRNTLVQKGIKNVGIWSRGIDFKAFCPEYRSQELRKRLGCQDALMLLYVGRLSLEKDLDILMTAFEQIQQRYGSRIKLVLTGDGPYGEEIKKKAPGNVIFTGYKKGRELAEIYASGDIFAFPSTTETFGNVVLEAMASGLPVVGAAAGGVQDIIEDGYNGFLCPPRDAASFKAALIKLIDDANIRNTFASNARYSACQRDWNKIFDDLISDYKKAVEAKDIRIYA